MSSPVTQDKDFQGCQALNVRLHNITVEGDIPSPSKLDGCIYYFAPNGDKHPAVFDAQANALRKLAFLDEVGSAVLVFEQVSPATTWGPFTHNFGRLPDATVIIGGRVAGANVNVTTTTATVTLDSAQSGYLLLRS